VTSPDRLRIVDRWERSGLSAAAFAPTVGVSAWTLYAWRKRGPRGSVSPPSPAFVELAPSKGLRTPHGAAHGRLFEIALPRDITLRVAPGFDSAELRRIVAALVA